MDIREQLKKVKALVFDVDGVLSSEVSPLGADGVPLRTTNVKDGLAMRNAMNMGYEVAIITGGDAERVKLRYEKIKVKHIYMCVEDKVEVMKEFASKNGLELDEILYMGDDLIDYRVMEMVGFPCCPSDAAEEVKEIATYISPKIGGAGCVRDVIQKVMRTQGTWINDKVFTGRAT